MGSRVPVKYIEKDQTNHFGVSPLAAVAKGAKIFPLDPWNP
jgi:hypothetical protein